MDPQDRYQELVSARLSAGGGEPSTEETEARAAWEYAQQPAGGDLTQLQSQGGSEGEAEIRELALTPNVPFSITYLDVRGSFHKVDLVSGAAKAVGCYAIEELNGFQSQEQAVAPILIMGVETTQNDATGQMSCLNNTKIMYTFGQAFGNVGISGEILLGPMGGMAIKDKGGVHRLLDFFWKYRVSNHHQPITVAINGEAFYTYLTGLRLGKIDQELHILPFVLVGTLLDLHREKGDSINPKSSVTSVGGLETGLSIFTGPAQVESKAGPMGYESGYDGPDYVEPAAKDSPVIFSEWTDDAWEEPSASDEAGRRADKDDKRKSDLDKLAAAKQRGRELESNGAVFDRSDTVQDQQRRRTDQHAENEKDAAFVKATEIEAGNSTTAAQELRYKQQFTAELERSQQDSLLLPDAKQAQINQRLYEAKLKNPDAGAKAIVDAAVKSAEYGRGLTDREQKQLQSTDLDRVTHPGVFKLENVKRLASIYADEKAQTWNGTQGTAVASGYDTGKHRAAKQAFYDTNRNFILSNSCQAYSDMSATGDQQGLNRLEALDKEFNLK